MYSQGQNNPECKSKSTILSQALFMPKHNYNKKQLKVIAFRIPAHC
jgi:hypothetical protein